ncbi:MAG: amidohydrolase family protein [Ardenticatenaceae bacterium]|nr:amidohydrolase family protein [Ardenticatenaceae bacterium]
MMDLVIRNGLSDTTGETIEVGIKNGLIEAVSSTPLPPGAREIDAEGGMISPAFFEAHFHLENAYLWDGLINQSGTLLEAIEIYAEVKHDLTTADIVQRAGRVIQAAVANGTLWLRSHVDIDHIAKLTILNGVAAAREQYRDLIDIQLVAFPQLGMARNPEAVDMMWQALEKGCDLVGGMPHGEKNMADAARHIELAFEMAEKFDVDIDMHIDETDDPYWHSLELLAEKTIESGWQGRVTAGHCCSMSAWDDAMAARIIEKVKQADIHVVTNAPINLMLEGRNHHHPKPRGIARVVELLQAGVNVVCGQDDVQNMFYPYGQMDPLEVAMITAHAAHMGAPEEIQAAFDMPRYHAARLWPLEKYGVKVGAEANLVVLDAKSPVEALRRRPVRRYVLRKGIIVVESQTQTTWHQGAALWK